MKNISKFVPAIFVAGVLTLTVPFLNRAKAEPDKRHEFVVFQAQDYYNIYNEGPPNYKTSYQWAGFFVINYEASPGAPKLYLPVLQDGGPYQVTTNQLSKVLTMLADRGFTLVQTDGKTWTFRN